MRNAKEAPARLCQLRGSSCSLIIFPRMPRAGIIAFKKKSLNRVSYDTLYNCKRHCYFPQLMFALFIPIQGTLQPMHEFTSFPLEGLLALTFSTGISVSPSKCSIFLLSVLSLTTNLINFHASCCAQSRNHKGTLRHLSPVRKPNGQIAGQQQYTRQYRWMVARYKIGIFELGLRP